MKVKYVHANNIYVISNHSVAKNAIFTNVYYRARFFKKAKAYLSPICEVLGYSFHRDQFQMVVKLASRDVFEKFYLDRKKSGEEAQIVIPKNTYIFSQLMANLQSSMAIHFNRREHRTGAVFARRFSKTVIRSAEELESWLTRMSKGEKFHYYVGRWRSKEVRERRWGKFWGMSDLEVKSAIKRYAKFNFLAKLQGRSTNHDNLDIIDPFYKFQRPKHPPN